MTTDMFATLQTFETLGNKGWAAFGNPLSPSGPGLASRPGATRINRAQGGGA